MNYLKVDLNMNPGYDFTFFLKNSNFLSPKERSKNFLGSLSRYHFSIASTLISSGSILFALSIKTFWQIKIKAIALTLSFKRGDIDLDYKQFT